MTKKTKEPQDLLVHWGTCGEMQVSSASEHSKWYSITVDKCGNLACDCKSSRWRPWDPCKHVQRAAEHIETVPASTPGQAAFAKQCCKDRARRFYREIESASDPEPPPGEPPAWWNDPDALPPMPPEPEPEPSRW